MPPLPVIGVSGICKAYGRTVAVDNVSFEVVEGEIFGLIGPNGAGKTTTMECVEGIRTPERGSISVLGLDPFADVYALQNRIGVQLQEAQLQKRIKVWEVVDLWASLYRTSVDGPALLEQLGLAEKQNAWFMTLSGGQKQRLFIALALINDPEVVFLDELTTGLDPQARRAIWDLVRGIRDRGKTVFMTTHLMEEAERLCDRVAIIEHRPRHRSRHAGRARAAPLSRADSRGRDRRPWCRGAFRRARWRGRGHASGRSRHDSWTGRRSGDRCDPMPVGAPHSGYRLPHHRADP
jgi:ABC-2 type transport system ATP-binding protein